MRRYLPFTVLILAVLAVSIGAFVLLFGFSSADSPEESAEPRRTPIIIGLTTAQVVRTNTPEIYAAPTLAPPTATVAAPDTTGRPTARVADMGDSYGIAVVGDETLGEGIVPVEWRTPPDIAPRYELIITTTEEIVQRCQYSESPVSSSVRGEVIRERVDIDLTLIELASGQVIASEFFAGQSPESCPVTANFTGPFASTQTQRGMPDMAELLLWLTDALSDRSDLDRPGFALRGYRFTCARYSPDGTTIVTTIDGQPAMRLWDATTGAERLVFEDAPDGTDYPRFNPAGTLIVTGTLNMRADRIVRVWDAATGAERLQIAGPGDVLPMGPATANFSPDGQYIVTAGDTDHVVRIWDAQTGEEIRQLSGHQDPVGAAAFSPDGSRIVSVGHDRTARLWDAETGAEQLTFQYRWSRCFEGDHRVAFSPDGRLIAMTVTLECILPPESGTVTRIAVVWDAQNGEEVFRLDGHTGTVLDVTFSPDGRFIATASVDQTARVWDAQTGEELYRIVGHTGPVRSVSFSPDSRTLLTASDDNTVRNWNLPEPGATSP